MARKRKRTKQDVPIDMFGADDTPLFSGTPVVVVVAESHEEPEEAAPAVSDAQMPLPLDGLAAPPHPRKPRRAPTRTDPRCSASERREP